jgi:hypothetical protein
MSRKLAIGVARSRRSALSGGLALVALIPFAAADAATGAAPAGQPGAATAGIVKLVPHRAVYEMTLDSSRSGSGVTDLTGRMVFEITGSACEGYTQNMRFVMETTNRDGTSTVTDMRSSSWEDGNATRYRFTTSNWRDQEQTDGTAGNAQRSGSDGEIKIDLTKPKATDLKLPAKVVFPVQHSRLLIEAGEAGRTVLEADLYDGSDKGEKVYATTAVIGRQLTAEPAGVKAKVKNAERLAGVVSWPVSISYFDQGKEKEDSLPVYEISFRYYANGVSENLLIDYGDFSIKGALKDIEFTETARCELERK